jgi:hypothetical protein
MQQQASREIGCQAWNQLIGTRPLIAPTREWKVNPAQAPIQHRLIQLIYKTGSEFFYLHEKTQLAVMRQKSIILLSESCDNELIHFMPPAHGGHPN